MKGVLSKFLRLLCVVLLIINTIPKSLYAEGEEPAAEVQEEIVEAAPVEEAPAPEPTPEPVAPVAESPPAEPAKPAEESAPKEEPVVQEEKEPEVAEPVKEVEEAVSEEETTQDVAPEAALEETEVKAEVESEEEAVAETEEEIVYVIYFEASENGLILADPDHPVKEFRQEVKAKEELVSVTAKADEGFEFKEWQLNGEHFSDDPVLNASQIELKDKDKYKALFEEIKEEEAVEEVEVEVGEETEELEESEEETIYEIFFAALENGQIRLDAEESALQGEIRQEVKEKEELISVIAEAMKAMNLSNGS